MLNQNKDGNFMLFWNLKRYQSELDRSITIYLKENWQLKQQVPKKAMRTKKKQK